MRSSFALIASAAVILLVLAGCGGGGGSAPLSGVTPSSVGTLSAAVSLQGVSPSSLTVEVDGEPVTSPVSADGSFTVPGLAPGDHVVDVIGSSGMQAGRATFSITAGGTSTLAAPIPLSGSGIITGTVVSQAGTGPSIPMPGVQVTARADLRIMSATNGSSTLVPTSDPSSPITFPPPPGQTYTAITDTNGAYKMTGVASGWYLVSAMVPGYLPAYAWVLVTADATVEADLVLTPTTTTGGVGTVQGTVTGTDSTGATNPIEGATVTVAMGAAWVPPSPPSLPILSTGSPTTPTILPPPDVAVGVFRTLTDATGHYSLNVPAGNGTASAWAQGYAPSSQSITLASGATLLVNFLLKVLPDVPPGPPTVPSEPSPPPPPSG